MPVLEPVTIATRPDWSGTSAADHLAVMTSTIPTAGYGRLRVGARSGSGGRGRRWRGRRGRCRDARPARGGNAVEAAAGDRRGAQAQPLTDEPQGAPQRRVGWHADVDHPPRRAD